MTPSPQKTKVTRAPVVVIMGHIDHGKSTLLDYIRKSNVVAGEAGGITQHVGAYEAEHTNAEGVKRTITFLDTPGHEAFTNIRERGAQAADIAILIVSAEDGVKPQTVEAYKNIKNEKLPFIVAITKIDKPNADVDRAKQSLGEHEIYVEGWGGDVPCVPISSVTGQGVPELLDMIGLVADLADLSTDPSLPASGVIVESSRDPRKGISATLLIKDGTLEIGSFVVAEDSFTPVRAIEDFAGIKIDSAGASRPVRLLGWSSIPRSGAVFSVATNKKTAEKMTEQFIADAKSKKPVAQKKSDEESQIVTIPLIIKADVIGSLEGVKHELAKIKHDKVQLKIVHEGIGEINENDVKTALGDPTIIIVGFNVTPDKKSAAMIERSSTPLNVTTFKIIYELSHYVQKALEAKIPKEYIEEVLGRAKILAIFSKEKDRQVVGGKVESGLIETGNDIRIVRRDAEIGRGKIRELQEKKLRTTEVAEGHECGMMLEAKIELAPGDRIEAVHTIEKK